jgi:hypothetical protein
MTATGGDGVITIGSNLQPRSFRGSPTAVDPTCSMDELGPDGAIAVQDAVLGQGFLGSSVPWSHGTHVRPRARNLNRPGRP